jgi:uncharacterized protein (DUF305 family)
MNRRLTAVLALPFTLTILLAACSSSNEGTKTEASSDTNSSGLISDGAVFNAADVSFAQDMIPHHQQAVEMAIIALDPKRGAGSEVKDLATRIQGAQGPEIELMTGWLTAWEQPLMAGMTAGETMAVGETHSMEGMDGMSEMEGMMSAKEMAGLEKANGPAFDKMWLEMMIRHHDGAVSMSKTVQAAGKIPETIALAGKIITAQEAEIAEMKKILAA